MLLKHLEKGTSIKKKLKTGGGKKKKAHLLMLVVFGGEELDLLLKRLAEAVKPLFAGHHIAFVRLSLLTKLRNVAKFLFFFSFFFACAFRRYCSTLHQIASSNFFFFRQGYCSCEPATDGGFFCFLPDF